MEKDTAGELSCVTRLRLAVETGAWDQLEAYPEAYRRAVTNLFGEDVACLFWSAYEGSLESAWEFHQLAVKREVLVQLCRWPSGIVRAEVDCFAARSHCPARALLLADLEFLDR